MCGVIGVEFRKGFLRLPGYEVGPFDAVFGLTRDGGEGAEGDCGAGGVHVELAFEAGCHCW